MQKEGEEIEGMKGGVMNEGERGSGRKKRRVMRDER